MPTRGLINPELLTDIADAIRAKNGTSAGMTPAQMAEAISNLELSEAIKQALLNCFAHVAWIDDQGQSYYDALEDALYPTAPPAELLSISAVFEQGQTVIYDTDSLDDLKPMLTVTAHYSDSTSAEVTTYTLSGTLAVGTSTITVSYCGKTATFTVTVTAYWDFEWDYTQGKLEEQDGFYVDKTASGISSALVTDGEQISQTGSDKYFQILINANGPLASLRYMQSGQGVVECVMKANVPTATVANGRFRIAAVKDSTCRISLAIDSGKWRIRNNATMTNCTPVADFENDVEYTLRLVLKGSTADVYINGTLVAENVDTSSITSDASNSMIAMPGYSNDTSGYVILKAYRIKSGG